MNGLGYVLTIPTPLGPTKVDLPLERIVKDLADQAKPVIKEEVDQAMARATNLGLALGVGILAAIGVSTWYIASLHKR